MRFYKSRGTGFFFVGLKVARLTIEIHSGGREFYGNNDPIGSICVSALFISAGANPAEEGN